MRCAGASWVVGLAVVAAFTLPVCGCSSVKKSVEGWVRPGSPDETVAADVSEARRVYYAGVEGLKVYSEPSASSRPVGSLSLHEKVTRSKLDRGYAYVESAKSGVKGWVNNAELVWRLPGAAPGRTTTTTQPIPETTSVTQPAATTTLPESSSAPLPSSVSGSQAPQEGVSPSILDSY